MKLMMKFCLCFHKITELWNLFSPVHVGNYFSVLFQAIIYVFSFKKNVKMTGKHLNYSGTDFCPLKPEIAPSAIGFRLKFTCSLFFLKAKALHSKFSRIWRNCFLWLVDSGFWFSSVFSGSGFLILGFPDNRQASPPKHQMPMDMNRQTNAKQTKARIQPKRNKQTAESAENNYATRRKK